MTDPRRALPSVSALIEVPGVRALFSAAPREVVVRALRDVVGGVREGVRATPVDMDAWASAIAEEVARIQRRSLRRVINATGVVLHTNLGRAPLARSAIDAVARLAGGYTNLEYDIEAGARGSRYVHCATLLKELTGAEDALVMNNCAAALVLALNTVAAGRGALLSRGELVEIGGSFRVHEIMAKSGAHLREVGATNRTHLADYARAIDGQTGAILKVHRGNFSIEGFASEVETRELAPLAAEHGIPLIHDLGSGLLISLADLGLVGEPTARDAFAAGADIVVMSGDKLLGGPQAGIIVGRSEYVAQMRENPLARSYRVDKLTLAALEITLALHRDPAVAREQIPVLAMLGTPLDVLRHRATTLRDALRALGIAADVVGSEGAVGAGAFPSARLPGFAVALDGNADQLARGLRCATDVVIGRIHDGRLLLDVRTIQADEVDAVITAIQETHA